uniref:NADH-ubiquinone oxidoreductase chain 4L n=1 Tax=Paurocephala sauteri TaxID=2768670 RepID=A0A7L9R5A0_9HEMI|nr:NADH dehydrogenase subunit 4L [Paurocephala sauteri]QOL10536.1 NADH dehydrogenase subunit 4L [Paurocephala sauteri]
MFFSILLFLLGMKMFMSMKKYLLMMLLSLEFLSLILLVNLLNLLNLFSYDSSLIIYFIIIMTCEAVMGLILLTLFSRTHGSDYLKSLNMFMC